MSAVSIFGLMTKGDKKMPLMQSDILAFKMIVSDKCIISIDKTAIITIKTTCFQCIKQLFTYPEQRIFDD